MEKRVHMRVAIFENDGKKSQKVSKELYQKLVDAHIPIDNDDPEIVITVGGDGTLLAAFRNYQDNLQNIRFVGVHTGHLGFYTDWRDDEIDDLVISLQSDNKQSINYPLLDVKVEYYDAEPEKFLALNESTLKRINNTMVTDVYIGDQLFEKFRGDGLCISTPTGSTAYNKSVGGAVIHPGLESLQMAEIASINNRVFRTLSSPVIVASNDWITLKPTQSGDFIFSVDQEIYHNKQIKMIKYRVAKERICFAKYRHNDFWKRVNEAFIGSDYED